MRLSELKTRLRSLHFQIRMPTTSKHYTVAEAAEFLGVGPARVRDFIADGRLIAERVGGKMWLIREDDLKRFAALPRPTGRPVKRRLRSRWQEQRREAAARANAARKEAV